MAGRELGAGVDFFESTLKSQKVQTSGDFPWESSPGYLLEIIQIFLYLYC